VKVSKTTQSVIGCLATVCLLQQASAAQVADEETFDVSLNLGVEHTDNVQRTAVNEESQDVGVAGLQLEINSKRPRLVTDVSGNLEYKDYLDDAFDSELVGGVDASLDFAFIPQHLHWVVEDNFGQIANQRQLADTPDNRQNVNYLSTGPDITFSMGGRTALKLSGRYGDAYYENTPEDNQSLGGSVALIRRVADKAAWSVNASTTEVEYDEDELFAKYRLNNGYLRYEAEGSRTTFSADAGYTEVESDGDKVSDGPLFRVELSRAVATRSRVGFQAGTEFTTPGEAFRRNQTVAGIQTTGADDGLPITDPYQLDYAYLTFSTLWTRGSLVATLNARNEEHEIVTQQDRDIRGASLQVTRRLTPRVSADLGGFYDKEEFVNTDVDFDEWNVTLGVTWLLGRGFSLNVRLDHLEGSSDDGLRDYEENRGYIGIAYAPRRRGS
jgi:hypothetical protein